MFIRVFHFFLELSRVSEVCLVGFSYVFLEIFVWGFQVVLIFLLLRSTWCVVVSDGITEI